MKSTKHKVSVGGTGGWGDVRAECSCGWQGNPVDSTELAWRDARTHQRRAR